MLKQFSLVKNAAYFLFWVLYFICARVLFLSYHQAETKTLSSSEFLKVFRFGLWLDMSFAAYLSVIPFILIFLQNLLPKVKIRRIITIYTLILLIVISFLIIADLELYTAWGFRINSVALQYFNAPKEISSIFYERKLFQQYYIIG